MKRRTSIFFGLICLIAIAAVSASSQANVESFNSISRQEIELLLADVAKTNPAIVKKLADDPKMKRKQIEDLKQLLAFASQALADGMASDTTNRQEMDNIRAEIIAVNYDKEINKGKAAMPPFGHVTDGQVASYWGGQDHEAEFQRFLDAKVTILRASDPQMKDRQISEDEKTQARDVFARTRIYLAEYEQKLNDGKLVKDFIDKANLQVKLQQAQFLARIYAEKIADQIKATDAEVATYIAAHPEIDPAKKRATAQALLVRARAGEDFAMLANKFTQDPGNEGADGLLHGGLYKNVPKGRMEAPFEAAALALLPGQVAPNLVETDYGFHIIKLERKSTVKMADGGASLIYDVRHILISTGVKDPEKLNARETPVNDYVRDKLEAENEKRLSDAIVAENHIQVPEDFTIPQPVPEPVRKKTTKKRPVRKK